MDKAMQDMIQEIVSIRNTYLKLQQSYLQIDENNVDGKDIQECDLSLLEINLSQLDRNKRLISIATKTLSKGDVVDLDQLSIDSDELITT